MQKAKTGFGLPDLLTALVDGWSDYPPRVLQPYHQAPVVMRHRIKKLILLSLIAFVGMIYGFMSAIFPTYFYTFMAVPLIIMGVFILWALPENDRVSERAIHWLFFAMVIGLGTWPSYLAISLPGLPWITMTRLFVFPLTALFFLGLSLSPNLRAEIKAIWNESPWVFKGVILFAALFAATTPLSGDIGFSLNYMVNRQIEWIVVFFVAAWIFSKEGMARKWAIIFCCSAVFISAITMWEWRISRIPWATHIPSFLKVDDEAVIKMLNGSARFGIYRTQSIFPTPLNCAEYLALTTPFFIYFFQEARQFAVRVGCLLFLPMLFLAIRGTDGRLGAVGFFAAFFIYFLVWGVRRWAAYRRDLIGPFVVLAYPVLIIAFYILSISWGRLRLMTWGGGVHQPSNEARELQWEMGIPKILSWPFGYGPAQAGETLGYRNGAGVVSVDTYYLTVLLDVGILGFIGLFGALLTAAAMGIYKGVLMEKREEDIMIPAAIALTCFVIIKGVLSQVGNHSTAFMMLGMVVGLLYRTRKIEPILGKPKRVKQV